MSLSEAMTEYRSAQATLRVAAPTSAIHELAQKTIDELGPKRYNVPIVCIICRRPIPGLVSIAEVASWTDEPRCICDKCDARITADVQAQVEAHKPAGEQ